MTILKDKLSASVRRAKSGAPDVPSATVSGNVATKGATCPPLPKAVEPAPSSPPAACSGILFPDRVWPD